MTWRALKDSDDFAKIKNLSHIKDHRNLISALYEYEKLMTNEAFSKQEIKDYEKKEKARKKENEKLKEQNKKQEKSTGQLKQKEKMTRRNKLLDHSECP